MAGKKIDQARRALRFVLDNLREDDTFNIVAYDDRVETFRPELLRYSPRTRDEAVRFVDNIREGGIDRHQCGPEGRPGDDPRRLAAQLRAVPDRRPADGRRNQRDDDRRELPQGQRRPRPRLRLRRRLRRQRPAARPAQRRQQRDEHLRQARRGHRDPGRAVLREVDQPRPGRHPRRIRLAATSTASTPATFPTCSTAAS